MVRAGGQPLIVVAALELHVAVADQVEVPDRRRRALEQLEVALDVEVDLGYPSAVLQFDLGDLADLHARCTDELARRADHWHC